MTILGVCSLGTPLDGNDGMFIVEDRSGYGWELTMVCSGMIRKTILFLIILLMVFPVPFLLFVRRYVMRTAFGLKLQRASVFGYSADESEEIRSLFGCHNRYMCKWKICSAICGRWRQE